MPEDGLEPSAFLKDGIHLNDKGCALYAQIVGENLRRVPELGDNPEDAGTITQIPLTDPHQMWVVERYPAGPDRPARAGGDRGPIGPVGRCELPCERGRPRLPERVRAHGERRLQ